MGAAGTLIFIFEFRNTSDEVCYLSGFASVQLQDNQGNTLPVSSTIFEDGQPPVVNLTPGSEQVPSTNEQLGTSATGHAFASFFLGHCESTGFAPAAWLITPPGESASLMVAGPTQFSNGYPVCVSGTPAVRAFHSTP
jgi:hypothetical protein